MGSSFQFVTQNLFCLRWPGLFIPAPHTLLCCIGLTGKLLVVSSLIAFSVRGFRDPWPETTIKEEENINTVGLNIAMRKLSIWREEAA
jgi:hypothetical protein